PNLAEDSAAAGGTTAAAVDVAGSAATTIGITGGFPRSNLPETLANLRATASYDVSGASVTTIGESGMSVAVQGTAPVTLNATASSAAGESHVMWMQALALSGSANPGVMFTGLTATAGGSASD